MDTWQTLVLSSKVIWAGFPRRQLICPTGDMRPRPRRCVASGRDTALIRLGNSGQPSSPHYRDQSTDWLAGRYHVISLKREEVERHLESKVRLERSESTTA